MVLLLWISLFIVFYTFFGYGIVLFLLVKLKRLIKGERSLHYDMEHLPSLTLIVTAYNETEIIEEKIQNTLALNYPAGKLTFLFITDGSSDDTPEKISMYPGIFLMHAPERKGKVNAMHRAVQEVRTDVIVFTDANTFLNPDALVNIARQDNLRQVYSVFFLQ